MNRDETPLVAASRFVGAVVFAIATGSGCSSNDCRVPVDQLGCAATFAAQVQQRSSDPSACPVAGPCGAHLVWRFAPGTGSDTCDYDGSGQQLLSAETCTDVPLSCGSLCRTGGQSLDVDHDCDVSALPPACSNADGGPASD